MVNVLFSRTLISKSEDVRPEALIPAESAGLTRSMSGAGLLLAACALSLERRTLERIRSDSDRVGIYCVTDPIVTSEGEIAEFLRSPPEQEFSQFARLIPPKWILQSSVSLVGASLSILLGVQGPTQTFHHPKFGCLHALNQAKLDLEFRNIDLAILCTVSGASGAAAMVGLTRESGEFTLCSKGDSKYGIASPIMSALV